MEGEIVMYELRYYQKNAVEAGLNFLQGKHNGGLIILPTGAGKSLVIAAIANALKSPLLVLQPSKEILEQNFKKLTDFQYFDCGIYSASFSRKDVKMVTFATIGSIINKTEQFSQFKYCVIDECHLVNPQKGMYADFLRTTNMKVLGLTATPYRLYSSKNYGSMLRFITRTRPRIFSNILYFCQISELAKQGYLAPMNYYSIKCGIDTSKLQVNTTYTDYTDESVKRAYDEVNFCDAITNIVERLLVKKRKILVFTRFVQEAEYCVRKIGEKAALVYSGMPKAERERTLEYFKQGKISAIANVGVLTTGFDFPALDTIVIARPTMSLALYYQMVGRAMRPYPNKVGWIVDLCGTYLRFGKVEDMELKFNQNQQPAYYSAGKQLTNVFMKR